MKTLFVPCFSRKTLSFSQLKKLGLQRLPYLRIGLFSTIQHLPELKKVKKFLERDNKEVLLGGQILGCSKEKIKKISSRVDAFLYLGSGKFHPLEIAIHSHKPVFVINPYSGSLSEISRKDLQSYEKKRKGALAKALEAEVFGVLVSTKTGQFSLSQAKKIKEKIELTGKKAFLFAGDEISPDRLLGFKVDAWINTACPRIVEDYFDKPVLNPEELELIA